MQSKSKGAPGSKSEARLTPKQRKAQQQQQQQIFIIASLAIVIVVLVVIGFVLVSHPAVSGSSADARYANIPAGITTTGPAAGITYPVPLPYIGDPAALVKIEEIGSFSCPICRQYHDQSFSGYFSEIQAGHLQFIYLPTTLTGDFNAVPGTQASYCAMQQQVGKFWPMYDLLYDEQKRYAGDAARRDHLDALAKQISLDTAQLDTCLDSAGANSFVKITNNYADQRGLRGTPTIFIYVKGVQITPSQISPNQTPGDMSGMSPDQLKALIANALKS
jgi:protein-disulfide isomerase